MFAVDVPEHCHNKCLIQDPIDPENSIYQCNITEEYCRNMVSINSL